MLQITRRNLLVEHLSVSALQNSARCCNDTDLLAAVGTRVAAFRQVRLLLLYLRDKVIDA